MLILAVGIGIVFCIIVFICYSYKQNQRSKYTSEVYKVFKGQYGRESVISMGYAQTNAFTEPVTLMLAVSKDDHRVVDAWEVTQEEMENSCCLLYTSYRYKDRLRKQLFLNDRRCPERNDREDHREGI